METGLRFRVKRAGRQIADQHRHLRSIYEAIRDAVKRGVAQEARDGLVRLQGAIDAHFALEDDVFFPALHGLHPDYTEALEALSGEHARFVEELRRMGEEL